MPEAQKTRGAFRSVLVSRWCRAFQRAALLGLVVLAFGCSTPASDGDFSGGDPVRGKQVAALAGGCGCHTERAGPLLAGGNALATPFGNFYATNITSDPVHGIGAWTDAEIERAIRKGTLPDGSVEAPVMPYYRYAGMSDSDVRDLIAWLRTVPPSDRRNRPDETWIPMASFAMRAWRTLFAVPVAPPAHAPSGEGRGRYLTEAVAICGDCHTPRNAVGAPRRSLYLAGATGLPGGEKAPNITPDKETGIGTWDVADIASCLEMGMLPNMDNVQGLMEEVVDGVAGGPGYANAAVSDLEAIAAYIASVPAIRHEPGKGR